MRLYSLRRGANKTAAALRNECAKRIQEELLNVFKNVFSSSLSCRSQRVVAVARFMTKDWRVNRNRTCGYDTEKSNLRGTCTKKQEMLVHTDTSHTYGYNSLKTERIRQRIKIIIQFGKRSSLTFK